MSVRRLGIGDLFVVVEVLRRFKGYQAVDPWDFLADPYSILFVAEEHGRVVGWLYGYELVLPEGRRMMLLYEMEVDDGARDRGHGRALVEALLSVARLRGHVHVWVLTALDDVEAHALFSALGGRSTGPQLMYVWNLRSWVPETAD